MFFVPNSKPGDNILLFLSKLNRRVSMIYTKEAPLITQGDFHNLYVHLVGRGWAILAFAKVFVGNNNN